MKEEVYRAIAKKNGVSFTEVKREMQKAIDAAYVFPTPEALKVPRKNAIPTVDEIIAYTVQCIANKTN